MNSERRYTEDEVGKILDRATAADSTRGPGSDGSIGLTLRELHEIGTEVGIPEEVITQAATSLDRPEPKPATTQTGLFLVSRLTVPLWAKERSRQFEDIIARLTHRIGPEVIESGEPPST